MSVTAANIRSLSLSPQKAKFAPLLFAGDLEKGLQQASCLGYGGVELSLRDASQIRQEWLEEKLSGLELSVTAIATGQTYYTDGYSLYEADGDKRRQCVRRVIDHIDLAARLHCAVIIGGIRGTCPPDLEGRKVQERKGKESLKACAAHAEEKGVILLIEPINRYETNVVNTLAEGLDLITEIGLSSLRLLADTFHMNIEEADITEALRAASSFLRYVHLADSNRLAPGWGHLDFRKILGCLESLHYTGPLGIEVLPKPDDQSAARQAIRYLSDR